MNSNRTRRFSQIVLLLAGLLAPLPSVARPVLRVLAWPGYVAPDIVANFEQRFGVEVQVSLVTSDDELWQRVNARQGQDFDLFAVNTAELQRYIEAGLVAPIDLSRVPNHARQSARFQHLEDIPGLVRDGQVFAMPYTYSEMGIIYNRRLVADPPDSLAELWDPIYRGKVLAFDTSNHNFTLAGMLLGARDPFRLDNSEFGIATRKLIDLRRNVLTFYRSPEEVVRLFGRHPVALVFANYGSQQVKLLRASGADIGYVIPREGALAWLDCWSVTRGAEDRELAMAWINYMLEPTVSDALTRRQGLVNTLTPNPRTTDEDRIIWLRPLEDYAKRAEWWSRIRSGEVPGRTTRTALREGD